ncbi:FAD binding domain-containing protein [Nocardioides aurantiacus]|uniref:Xanthine dehydrogenase YagS FAD-binding subunit n=1 Tax=Nocardioides aurantiacus TaxID=86796 RepID=A0A3N2CS86_9ACTN|nr:xanthine dehydrogenase family protein subunit M [Nocardioides aurantiacus]ROR90228.1 xanthine dehydrogenase YagS FAD-binding subunit [Nocardioides aurantiacus]
MRTFTYLRPDDVAGAVEAVAADAEARFIAGGSNLVDHLKLGVARPGTLVDVTRLGLDAIEPHEGGLRVGANVRNSDLAAHPVVRQRYPAVARALLAGASGQIRHQATTAGNLLQRTRCVYFQDVTTPCHKREPGSGCSAVEGYGRYNAILGASESCVAVHPSDLAVALTAVDAVVVVQGPGGERRVPMTELHRLPGDRPQDDTVLEHGDLVVAVELPDSPVSGLSTYYKARDRASYAFALVSVAAAVDLDGDTVRDLRVVWGGVAHKPWRATTLEDRLRGHVLTEETVAAAADAELSDAVTTADNAYKPAMVRGATIHALTGLARRAGAATTEGVDA